MVRVAGQLPVVGPGFQVAGDSVALIVGPTALPTRFTEVPGTKFVPVTVSVAVVWPTVAGAVKTKYRLQLEPAFRFVPQVPPGAPANRVKFGDEIAKLRFCNCALPVFWTLSPMWLLVVPITTRLNVNPLTGLNATAGAGGATDPVRVTGELVTLAGVANGAPASE